MHAGGIPRDRRIAVVGAGAAGLCVAWYLKQAGFTRVKVLEKSPRLGGKCRSLTVHGQSFDLGANYVTSAYARVQELAAHVGAAMYTEKPGHVFELEQGRERARVGPILAGVLEGKSLLTLAWQSLRYLWKRWRLRRQLSPYRPGFAHVRDCPELQGSFADWLRRHRLDALAPIFEIPLTRMGYGALDEIAAAYALTYMSPHTFKDLGVFAANLPFRRWPKRFTFGYGRLFERLAAEVDVLTGVRILEIKRGEQVEISYLLLEQQLEGETSVPERETFDYLVLACPQLTAVLEPFLDLTPRERRLFDQVVFNPFFVSTYHAPGTEEIAAVTFALRDPPDGQPCVVTRQYPENDFISVYSRGDRAGRITREQVEANNVAFLPRINASVAHRHASTDDDWAYFPHVPVGAMDAGFYGELEGMQGTNRTFYCGGLLAFELVEAIAEHAHRLVQDKFAGKGNA